MLQPAFDQGGVGLEVELQAPGVIADPIGLLATTARPGERHRVGWWPERVRMPLEHVTWRAFEMPEQAVLVCVRSRMQPVPADLRHGVGMHVTAHRLRQQLATEADAEYRLLCQYCSTNDVDFGREVRKLLDLVHVHRAAQHHQAVVAADVGLGMRLAAEIDVADPEAGVAQQRVEVAEGFRRDVLEDEQFAHA